MGFLPDMEMVEKKHKDEIKKALQNQKIKLQEKYSKQIKEEKLKTQKKYEKKIAEIKHNLIKKYKENNDSKKIKDKFEKYNKKNMMLCKYDDANQTEYKHFNNKLFVDGIEFPSKKNKDRDQFLYNPFDILNSEKKSNSSKNTEIFVNFEDLELVINFEGVSGKKIACSK